MLRDLMLLAGLAFLPLAFVAFVAAWADRRRPVPGLILLILGAGMVGWAHFNHPAGGYDWADVPDLALSVLARLLY
ncbi:MAG: Protein of unknown function (DUF3028) [Rhodobacteraceae bacterium HLUCCA12]|nr:MAG: Protein of unknown function (DUF3028) [Rhodobacteraceae bacterium HLUCCA12]